MYLQSIKSVKHNATMSINRSILKKSRQIGIGHLQLIPLRTTWTGDLECREVKTRFCRKRYRNTNRFFWDSHWLEIWKKPRMPLCGTLLLSATRPLTLINGCQGHPLSCLVTWDRPAATEPGMRKGWTRNHFIQLAFADKADMWFKPENRKDPLTMTCI